MPDENRISLQVDVRRLTWTIFAVFLCLEIAWVLLDYHVNYRNRADVSAIRRLFNITREDGIASWFAVTQTFLSGLTCWVVWTVVRRQDAVRWRRIGWLVLALLFTYMAVDDGAKIHERLGTAFEVMAERAEASGEESFAGTLLDFFPSYPWQVVFLPFFGALGLFTLVFLWFELGGGLPRLLVVVAIGCFVTAVSLDFVEGLAEKHPWNLYTWIAERWDLESFTEARFDESPFDTLRHFSKSIEEFLEMLGNTLLWYVFLRRLTETAPDLRFRFTAAERD